MNQAIATQASNDAAFAPAVAPGTELTSPADEGLQGMDAFIALKDDPDGGLTVESHVALALPGNSLSRIVATFICTNWDGIVKAAHQAYLQSLGTLNLTPDLAAPSESLKLINPNGGFVNAH
jgi:hypothetical protein